MTDDSSHRSRCVFAYHEFSMAQSRDVYQLRPEVFGMHLAALTSASAGARAALEITFDDAHRSQIELAAPILERAALHGLFFVPAGWVGSRRETATWSELRTLVDEGHRIGSHGQTHALLTLCSAAKLQEELVRSRETIEDRLGCAVETISMPGGRWNAEVAAACQAAGYRELYTSEPGLAPVRASLNSAVDSIAITHRLVVRRTMRLGALTGYARGDRFTMLRLQLEHEAKRSIKQMVGEQTYQAVWRRLLRAPIESVSSESV